MTQEEYDKLINYRLELIKSMLLKKGIEYSNNNNPFHTFEKAGILAGVTREDALKGFMLKHEVSILDILEKLRNKQYVEPNLIREKFGDVINYLIILEIMAIDKTTPLQQLPF